MPTLHQERLNKLADHLITGKLAHKEFAYGMFNEHKGDATRCGTRGCALGELPALYSSWKWIGCFESSFYGTVEYTDENGKKYLDFEGAMKFFNLSIEQIMHLFMPLGQITSTFGGEVLNGNATAEEVGNNIKQFITRA